MSSQKRKYSIAILGLLATLAAMGATATPVFAWNSCGLVLSPIGQSTSIGAGQTVTLTYLLTYSDSSQYAATFTVSASVTPGSPSGTWTVVSVTPPNPVPSSPSNSISQIISVKVTAPVVATSSTTLTVKAVNNYDSTSKCSTASSLSITPGSFPPPNGIPQFPAGMALLMALAIPALLLVRSRSKIIAA